MKNSTLPFPFAEAMDVINQVLFQIILASFTNGKFENGDLQKIASQLKVTHYDCGELTENNIYTLNQVSKCNNAPENLEVSRAKITMYTNHFRQQNNATVSRVKYQSEQWHCGFGDDSSMDAHHTGGLAIDLTVTASQCRSLAKGGSITLKDETLQFKKGVKTTVVKHKDIDDDGADLSNKYRNECDSYGWINRKTFEGHVKDVVLEVRTRDGKVMSKEGLQLPCPLEELGYDTTSFDAYAYTWDAPDNCVLAIHQKEDVNMIKQGKNNYYIVSGRNNTSQYLFEVKTKPEVFCNKPVQVYPTNYDSLYVVIDFDGFDLASGKGMGFSGGLQHLQYYQFSVSSDGKLFVHKHESPHTDKPNTETPHYLNLDYELHQGTKLDYLFFESSKMLEGFEIQLLKNLCEQERTQSLTILMLSMENLRLAGYLITGNRSMFLSTDGSLASLYHCSLMRSPPHVMNQCYDKIPIFYKNAIFFVDPITRQTNPDAQVQNCSDRIKNLFKFDMEDENSWFTITLTLDHRKRPAVFGPEDVTPVSRRAFGGAGDGGIYTLAQLSDFWDNILISAASRKALQKFSRELIVPNTAIHGPEQFSYYAPRNDFYVDNMISPSYLKNQFMDTFGSVAYVLEFCGIYFSCLLFIKLIVDLKIIILRHLEVIRLAGASLRFGRTLLSASNNLFLTCILTSVFNPQTPFLQALEREPMSTRKEDEARDPADENKKKRNNTFIRLFTAPLQLFPLFDRIIWALSLIAFLLIYYFHFFFMFFSRSQTTNHSLCWNTTNSTRCSTELTGTNLLYPHLI